MSEKLNKILDLVKEYVQEKNNKDWKPGEDWLAYSGPVFDEKEYQAAIETLLSGWLIYGENARKFELEFSQELGKAFGILTNSGSSANLLMTAALTSKDRYIQKKWDIKPGSKIITPIVCFPTTINPLIQCGFEPVFVDVTLPDLNLDLDQVEKLLEEDVNSEICAPVNIAYGLDIISTTYNGTDITGNCVEVLAGEYVRSIEVKYELTDMDGDGVADIFDMFPDLPEESFDTDMDGIGDNSDAFPFDANETVDSDGDGVGDNTDAFPDDATESVDTDGDGVGDNTDDDSDGDGVPNGLDAFPLDSGESSDRDRDGVGDDEDAFPDDPSEYIDTDGDGVGNNADTDDDSDGVSDSLDDFPLDPTESKDTDGDGVGDNADAFPNDATERTDTDGDGVGDNADKFPSDNTEWVDSDSDGTGDNSDAFPNDPTEIVDSDGDGVGNNADAFPYDNTETKDSDGDGVGDNAQAANDANVDTEPASEDEGGLLGLPGFSATLGIVSMLGAAILVSGRRKD